MAAFSFPPRLGVRGNGNSLEKRDRVAIKKRAHAQIVLYHGAAGWSVPRAFDALLDLPSGLRPAIDPYLPWFACLLDDLLDVSDDRLRSRAMTALARLVEMCFKHARTPADLVEMLGGWRCCCACSGGGSATR